MPNREQFDADLALYDEAVALYEAAKAEYEALEAGIQRTRAAGRTPSSIELAVTEATHARLFMAEVRLSRRLPPRRSDDDAPFALPPAQAVPTLSGR